MPLIQNQDQLQILSQPLDPSKVATRKGGGGKMLSYLQAHFVIEQMNAIFGHDGWVDELLELSDMGNGAAWRATVNVRANICGQSVSHTDVGFGAVNGGSITPDAIDTAMKGAVSDAFKRACRKFGDQFGNSLYSGESNSSGGGASQNNSSQYSSSNNAPRNNAPRNDAPRNDAPRSNASISSNGAAWNPEWEMKFGSCKGQRLCDMEARDLAWYRGIAVKGINEGSYVDRNNAMVEAIDELLNDRGQSVPSGNTAGDRDVTVAYSAQPALINDAQKSMVRNFAGQLFSQSKPNENADAALDDFCSEALGKTLSQLTPAEGSEIRKMLVDELAEFEEGRAEQKRAAEQPAAEYDPSQDPFEDQ